MCGVLAACSTKDVKQIDNVNQDRKEHVYLRSDTTAPYHQTVRYNSSNPVIMPYVVHSFHSGGHISSGGYQRTGYHNYDIPRTSNVGSNSTKTNTQFTPVRPTVRGGFGGTAKSTSSHSVSS